MTADPTMDARRGNDDDDPHPLTHRRTDEHTMNEHVKY
jgi:hypothetical protein